MKRNSYYTERELVAHSNEELVIAAKCGEEPAFIELSRRCSPMILRVLLRITKNEEDAEDALQETLMKAFIHLRGFDGRSSFSTWLTRIAINNALMMLRKGRKHCEISFEEFAENDHDPFVRYVDLAPNPEDVYFQTERRHRLQRSIQQLPPTLRECIEIQHTIDGSIQQIANITGISLSAAKSRLLRARRKLFTSLIGEDPAQYHQKEGGPLLKRHRSPLKESVL